jgi:hypothetical protein
VMITMLALLKPVIKTLVTVKFLISVATIIMLVPRMAAIVKLDVITIQFLVKTMMLALKKPVIPNVVVKSILSFAMITTLVP